MAKDMKLDSSGAEVDSRNELLANRALDMLRNDVAHAHKQGLTGKFGVEVCFHGGGIRMIRRLVDETIQNG